MPADRIPPGTPRAAAKARAFGEELRRAREARRLSLDALAATTRISRHHLEALERSDLEALPHGPFASGYIRSCARALGIDPEPILERYREGAAGTGGGDRQMLDELSHLVAARSPRKTSGMTRLPLRALALAVACLTVVAGLGFSLWRARARPRAAAPSVARSADERARTGERPAATRLPSGPVEQAAPKARATPALAPPRSTSAIAVPKHGVGRGVLNRQLVGPSDRFPAGASVAFWSLVTGGEPGQTVRHVWFEAGRAVMKAALPIRSGSFRTFSRLTLPQRCASRWAVEARTSDGRLLARDEFVCGADESP